MPLAADRTETLTAVWIPFFTLVMKYLQYCAALTQPSVSTHIMYTFLPAAVSAVWTALAVPRPDAASHREDDVRTLGDEVLRDRLAQGQVGEAAAKSPFWVCSFQPSTVTWVWCLLL